MTHRSLSGCPRAANLPSSTGGRSSKLDDLTNTLNRTALYFTEMTPNYDKFPEPVETPTDDDIRTLENEIFGLQEYNCKVQSDISKMRSEIHSIHHQAKSMDKVKQCYPSFLELHNLNASYRIMKTCRNILHN